MTRTKPTIGNLDWLGRYIHAFTAKLHHEIPPEQKNQVYDLSGQLTRALLSLSQLKHFNRFTDIPDKKSLPEDKTSHLEYNAPWEISTFEIIASNFGKHGTGTVSCLEEAVCYAHALASLFESSRIFYRGEDHYGHELKSRAERHMQKDEISNLGITKNEIDELRRFQNEVESCEDLKNEIIGNNNPIPRKNSPVWLPIMQHYDEAFGTRLLDISTSIYTGLYFSCISWDGNINSSKDGIIYVFLFGGHSAPQVRGIYYDTRPEDFDNEFDDLAPTDVTQSFINWEAPEYYRIYKSSSSSPREIAQDGWFLVRGSLNAPSKFGNGFKFRVPADAKKCIAKQLWLNGYTPERMVRGQKGKAARRQLQSILGI